MIEFFIYLEKKSFFLKHCISSFAVNKNYFHQRFFFRSLFLRLLITRNLFCSFNFDILDNKLQLVFNLKKWFISRPFVSNYITSKDLNFKYFYFSSAYELSCKGLLNCILQPYLEGSYSFSSHGFRPFRTSPDVLVEVKSKLIFTYEVNLFFASNSFSFTSIYFRSWVIKNLPFKRYFTFLLNNDNLLLNSYFMDNLSSDPFAYDFNSSFNLVFPFINLSVVGLVWFIFYIFKIFVKILFFLLFVYKVITLDLEDLLKIKCIIFDFLRLKGILCTENNFSIASFYDGFNFASWKFLFTRNNVFKGVLSLDNLKSYKIKLKNVLKISLRLGPLSMIKLLNYNITNWKNSFSSSDDSFSIIRVLDIFLYKLLWKWAKRRHPRRSSTWVFSKYWKKDDSLIYSQFFLVDYTAGKFLFLLTHSDSKKKTFSLPSMINVHLFQNYNKFGLTWFRKNFASLQNLYKVLWKKQSGLCFCCKSFFSLIDTKFLKVSKLVSNSGEIKIILLHKYCNLI
uniref:RoaA n=1 Tax=Lepocinclis tripteris TaxID=135494 RepID=A0A3G3LKW9_9EUGL|nr:RoaA [Lepocinclis tripteris]AYQ93356.1 RoaA [Lepocinclis tripteris]